MTISTSRGREMTVSQIVDKAFQLSGQINMAHQATAAQFGVAASLLDTIMDEVEIYGVYARQTVLENTTLTANDYTYTMDDYVLDIIGDGMYIDADETDLTKADGETIIKQISREIWHKQSGKGAVGRPNMFFFDRSLKEVKFWPIPDEAGTVRFQIYKKMSDSLEGTATLELEQYWYQYLIWELAHQVAVSSSLPIDRCSYFNKRAKEKLRRAKAWANPHQNIQVYVNHPTPWDGGRY